MRISAKQIFMAFVSMIVTLGVLFAAQRVYRATVVETPLMSQLSTVTGVQEAHLNGSTVEVRLKPGSNLMTVYQNVVSQASSALGHAPAKVVVAGHPDAVLTALVASTQFVVAQGEATGQFVAMKSTIESMAKKHHARVAMQLDRRDLYLTFSQGQHVLYDVIPIAIGGTGHA